MTLSRGARATIALLLAAVLFVAVNVVADRTLRATRVDLTQNHLYTLSQGTRATLAKLDEPIVLRFYYSPQLGDEIPSYGVYAQRVREMLEEYQADSNGKIELQILNPEPFSPVEDRAVAFGLQGVPVDQGGEQVYFGLAATNSTDDQQIIPFFQPERERFLEYDLTKLVHGLAFPKKPVVGLMTALPLEGDLMAAMQGRPMVPYVVIEQLKQLYDVQSVSTEVDKVPDNVDVLMIAHPQSLPDKTLYAIDQFVLKGGRCLVFVDPDSQTQQMHPSQLNPPGMPTGSDMEKLLNAWGLRMAPKVVAGDLVAARKVNAGTDARVVPVDYVAWLALKKANFNQDDQVTGDLSTITMATPGVLEATQGAKTTFTPLIQTSTQSEEIPVEKVQGMPDVEGLLKDFKPDGKRLTLAARITGPADTAFPDGPPPEPKKDADKDKPSSGASTPPAADEKPKEPLPPQIKTSAQPITVIVVADTDILEDRFWVQVQDFFGQKVELPVANNGDFVTNAVDTLAGGNDLIGLRSRGTSVRPFELVDDIQQAADEKYQATAKTLEDKIKDTQQKIKDLSDKEKNPGVTQTAGEEQALESFRTDMIRTRQQLRQVQLAEREDINTLKGWIEFFDIGAIPILVGLAALVVSFVRLERRKRRARTV
ncbi:MAG TPA: Gldg family protein [Stellaceae bacterium]|nr:Gldg family protein [Stellaceae bacterium]